MKINRILISLFVIAAIVGSLCVGIVFGHYNLPGTKPITAAANKARKAIMLSLRGREQFVEKTVDTFYQPDESNERPKVSERRIDTTRLPLILKTVSLDGVAGFAKGARLNGGAIARVEDTLVTLDKFGKIFEFDQQNSTFRLLEYPSIPLGLEDAIANTSLSLGERGAVRT